jgi:uncharacterized protein YbjQ (UPF0145 family)
LPGSADCSKWWIGLAAGRPGFDRAQYGAYATGVSLGVIEPRPELVREQSDRLAEGEQLHVGLLGRAVPVVQTPEGLRAVNKGKPGNPDQIAKYLTGKFGARIEDARRAMADLAAAYGRPISTGAGFGCASSSGRACRRANPGGMPWASWIWRSCERCCQTGNHSQRRAFKHRLRLFVGPARGPSRGCGHTGRDAGMIVTTTPSVEGRRVTAYLGLVTGEVILGANVVRDFFASVRDVVGGRSGSYEKVLRHARDAAVEDMVDEARAKGADAVLAVDLDYEVIGKEGSMLMVSACGTAVKLG